MADDLKRWENGEPVQARPTGPLPRAWEWARRRPALAGFVGLLALCLTLALLGVGPFLQLPPAEAERAAEEANPGKGAAEEINPAKDAVKAGEEAQPQERLTQQALYADRMTRAQAALKENALALAEGLLEECPRELRGWEWGYFKRRCHADLLTLKGHTADVLGVCFSPDGKRLASASWDRTVKVWDAATGQEALTLTGHTGGVTAVCFSPDGKRLASASADRTVKVWDATTGQEKLTLTGRTPSFGVYGVCFSPDGKRLASAALNNAVEVWDLATGQEVLTLKGHTGGVLGVCFSPDGKRLASAANGGQVKVWDAVTGQEALTLKGTLVVIGPDLLIAGRDHEELTLQGYTDDGFNGVCYSPDGKRLAGASTWDGMLEVWDAATGQQTLALLGHTGTVYSVCFSETLAKLVQ